MITIPKHTLDSVNGYWNMLKHLSTDEKIDLIILLSQSLKEDAKPKVSAKKYYGIWGEDGMTDQEFVDEIKSMRSFHRDIVELWHCRQALSKPFASTSQAQASCLGLRSTC